MIDAAREQAAKLSDVLRLPSSRPPPDALPGYEILRELHRGGQGVVYLAIQKTTKRRVALKVMHAGEFAGPKDRARFEREVEILGQLNHPNIVSIHDCGTSGGAYFYVMDYITGQPLDAHMKHADLSVDDTLGLFQKICGAVNAAHLKGVIHRDLKPGNILIDSDGEPYILDFGLAKIATGEVMDESHPRMMTVTGQFVGSLPWASPEQAEGIPGRIDTRSDVYSLGVVLYQMLTGGKFPYVVVGNMRDILDNILRAEPARPSTIRRQVDDEVETIVLKSLSKDRDRRYQTAGELARDVQHYLAGEPIEAKRDSGWYVIKKTLRRYKVATGVAAAFLILIVAFAITMSMLYRRAVDAEHDANLALSEAQTARAAEQTQRERAEAHFDAARDLAHTFIFDFHDEIEHLRGAMQARELILIKAQQYLEQVKGEAGDDPAFLRELADAHEKVADLRGGRFAGMTGTTQEAMAHFDEALRIRRLLLGLSPDDASLHADLGNTRFSISLVHRRSHDYEAARDEVEAAIAEHDTAIRLARAQGLDLTPLREDRLRALVGVGDIANLKAFGEDDRGAALAMCDEVLDAYDAAYREARRCADQGAPSTTTKHWLGVTLEKKARALLLVGSITLRGVADVIDADDLPEARARYDRAIGHYLDAEAFAVQSERIAAEVAAMEPADFDYQRDLFAARLQLGDILTRIAQAHDDLAHYVDGGDDELAEARDRREQALTCLRRALAGAERSANADETNLRAINDVGRCLLLIGDVLLRLDRLDEAGAELERCLSIREQIVAIDPIPQYRRDWAVAHYRLGQLGVKRGDAADSVNVKLGYYQTALTHADASLTAFRALADESSEGAGGSTIRFAEKLRAECADRLAQLEGEP